MFRCDASVRIGSGHVMRCLTLADELKKKGVNTVFISRELKGNLFNIIRERGHELIPLKAPELESTLDYTVISDEKFAEMKEKYK